MRTFMRLLGPAIAVLSFLFLPIGNLTQMMVLLVGLNIILGSMIVGDVVTRRQAVAVIRQDQRQLYLLRRTVPHLRANRPLGIIEAQVRWREASEAHRRRNQPVAIASNDQNPRIGPWPR